MKNRIWLKNETIIKIALTRRLRNCTFDSSLFHAVIPLKHCLCFCSAKGETCTPLLYPSAGTEGRLSGHQLVLLTVNFLSSTKPHSLSVPSRAL